MQGQRSGSRAAWYGQLDEDLKQYILMHIALNISKFKIWSLRKIGLEEIRGRYFLFSVLEMYEKNILFVFVGVRISPFFSDIEKQIVYSDTFRIE